MNAVEHKQSMSHLLWTSNMFLSTYGYLMWQFRPKVLRHDVFKASIDISQEGTK